MSSAIKVYLKQIAIHKGIPLKLTTKNGLTPEEEKEIFRAAKEARANVNVSQPMSAKEAVEHLMHLS